MNEKLETPGLGIREKPAKEANSLLTILTATQGVVLATAYGARKPGATLSSGTKLFNYSNFTLLESRGRYKVDSAQPIETFFGLSHSIEALTAASYFAEVLYDVCVTGQSDTQALRLALNSLFGLILLFHRPCGGGEGRTAVEARLDGVYFLLEIQDGLHQHLLVLVAESAGVFIAGHRRKEAVLFVGDEFPDVGRVKFHMVPFHRSRCRFQGGHRLGDVFQLSDVARPAVGTDEAYCFVAEIDLADIVFFSEFFREISE